jgi:hypothetical protein
MLLLILVVVLKKDGSRPEVNHIGFGFEGTNIFRIQNIGINRNTSRLPKKKKSCKFLWVLKNLKSYLKNSRINFSPPLKVQHRISEPFKSPASHILTMAYLTSRGTKHLSGEYKPDKENQAGEQIT